MTTHKLEFLDESSYIDVDAWERIIDVSPLRLSQLKTLRKELDTIEAYIDGKRK